MGTNDLEKTSTSFFRVKNIFYSEDGANVFFSDK
jgi:hypothetical protein